MGGYSLFVGGPVSTDPKDNRRIEGIEVYVHEYSDHMDTMVNIMSEGKIARQLLNCPVDIVYKEELDA
jgi:hypothetical protein